MLSDSLFVSALEVVLESFASELAREAFAAAVALDAVVAGEGFVADEVEDAELVGHLPGIRFVEPHQRCDNLKLLVHGEVECGVERFDEGVAAVWVTAEVGLRHAGDNRPDAELACPDGSHAEEKEIASRNEGVGECVLVAFRVHRFCRVDQGVVTQRTDDVALDESELRAGAMCHLAGNINLVAVALTVVERHGIEFFVVFLGPEEAGGGVLSATQHYEGCILLFHCLIEILAHCLTFSSLWS